MTAKPYDTLTSIDDAPFTAGLAGHHLESSKYLFQNVLRIVTRISKDSFGIIDIPKSKITWCEIGCGVGPILDMMNAKGYTNGYGTTLALSEVNYSGKDIRLNNIAIEPIETNKFDVVFFKHILQYVSNKDKTLSNCNKMLKPNGYLIFICECDTERNRMGFKDSVINFEQTVRLLIENGFIIENVTFKQDEKEYCFTCIKSKDL